VLVVRVLTVDDHESFRRAALALVTATEGMEEAGQACSAEEAIRAVDRLHPDMVLMDVRLPDMDGCEASRRIVAAHPGVVVVLISAAEEVLRGTDATQCAAAALVGKEDLRPNMLRAIWDAREAAGVETTT
jgi:two-component system, NarL family, invasion response regulator UvrY